MRRRSSDIGIADQPARKKLNIERPENIPDSIRCGGIITDIGKKQWRLGKSIGSGAFGDIYLVSDSIKEPVKTNAEYVAKFESHDSGPLFVEINCYLRAAKLQMIQQWLDEKNIHDIGVPHYISSGSQLTTSDRHRFLIIPRYGQDLDTIFKTKNNRFNLKTVLTISSQILDILEYLHSQGYVHSDIKGSNLLLGYGSENNNKSYGISLNKSKSVRQTRVCAVCNKKLVSHNDDSHDFVFKRQQSPNQIYLLDYGLASRFLTSDGEHKEFCDDMRKAHAGTVQFCSRDAHQGCTARRSDLENLGYNMLYWLTGKLPWDDVIADPNEVNTRKCEAMENLDKFLKNLLGDDCPKCILDYMKYVKKLSFSQQPNYDYCRKLFCKGLLEYGYKNDNYLDFDRVVSCDKFKKKIFKKVKKQSENSTEKTPKTKFLFDRKPFGINTAQQVMVVRKTTLRSAEKPRVLRKEKFSWAEVLSSDPEHILRQNKKSSAEKDVHSRSRKTTESSDTELNVLNIDLASMNPTYAMINVVNRAQERYNATLNNNVHSSRTQECYLDKRKGYTPAMEYVLTKKLAREQAEILQRFALHITPRKHSPRVTRSKSRVVPNKLPRKILHKTSKKRTVNNIKKMKKVTMVVKKRYSLRG